MRKILDDMVLLLECKKIIVIQVQSPTCTPILLYRKFINDIANPKLFISGLEEYQVKLSDKYMPVLQPLFHIVFQVLKVDHGQK